MHCNICDKTLSEKEISFNEDIKTYDPCTFCLDIIFDAAYSEGYKMDEDEYETVEEEFDYVDRYDLQDFDFNFKEARYFDD